jgi:hypothetical protein
MSNYLLVKEVINVMNVEELINEFNEKFYSLDKLA